MQIDSPSIADDLETRLFNDYKEVVTSLLAQVGLPMPYRILDRNEDPEHGHPILDISAFRWEQTAVGDVTAMVNAKLLSYGETNRLGSFRSDVPAPMTSSVDRIDMAYKAAMQMSITKILYALNTHFEPASAAPPASGTQ